MNILYQQNNVMLRSALPDDCRRLARTLRTHDRAELAASHPGVDAKTLVESFFCQSSSCFCLEWEQEPAALFGLCPDTLLGRRACVWLLTGTAVEKCPKTFVRAAKILLAHSLAKYPELYNFTDGRYASALRFIRRLGGRFDGSFYDTPSARFLYFTFRRK